MTLSNFSRQMQWLWKHRHKHDGEDFQTQIQVIRTTIEEQSDDIARSADELLEYLESGHGFLINAHRGDINPIDGYPENTLEAARQAAIRGADRIELDLRRSSEGTWHLMFNRTVDRTTDGTGNIDALTDAQIAALSVDGGFGYDSGRHGTTLTVPTLAGVLAALKPYDVVVEFDPRTGDGEDLSDADAVHLARFIIDQGWVPRAIVRVRTVSNAAAVKSIEERIQTLGTLSVEPNPESSTVIDQILLDVDTDTVTLATVTARSPAQVEAFRRVENFYDTDETTFIQDAFEAGVRSWMTRDLPGALAARDSVVSAVSTGDVFSIVLIPDTQHLSNSATWIEHFQAAADYIAANQDEINIELVLHLGDVVHNATTTEFDRAAAPMDTIWETGIPFAAAIGNHDYDGGSPDADHSDTTQWNTYFGTGKYTDRPWWDGAFETSGKTENFYFKTTLAGRPHLIIVLEFYPRSAKLTWAEGVIADHPHHDVIILTHSYLNDDGTLTLDATEHGPNAYSLTDSSNGQEMWDAFKQYPNVVAVFGGHHINGPFTAVLEDVGDEGNRVFQQFTNWQEDGEGGDGRIVILTINPHSGWALRQVYNAMDDAFEASHELTFRLYGQEGGGVSDHGALTGLADDDHTHYLTEARHGALAHEGGEILISDTPSTPLVFADLLQNEAQDDLLYSN